MLQQLVVPILFADDVTNDTTCINDYLWCVGLFSEHGLIGTYHPLNDDIDIVIDHRLFEQLANPTCRMTSWLYEHVLHGQLFRNGAVDERPQLTHYGVDR